MVFTKYSAEKFNEVWQFYREVVCHLQATTNYPKWDDDRPSKKGLTDAIKSGELYILTDGDTIVGAVTLGEDPEGNYEVGEWSTALHRGEYLTVHLFAVHPAYERKGIGTIMVQECIRTAREGGYKAIRLDTVPDNHPANHLYMKNGFTYAGTKDIERGIPEIPVFNLYELNL